MRVKLMNEDMIVESFSDGDKYYHHKRCFDLELANKMNQTFHLGTAEFTAVNIKEFIDNNDEMPADCFDCMDRIKD